MNTEKVEMPLLIYFIIRFPIANTAIVVPNLTEKIATKTTTTKTLAETDEVTLKIFTIKNTTKAAQPEAEAHSKVEEVEATDTMIEIC